MQPRVMNSFGIRTDGNYLRTARQTIALRDVDHVVVRRVLAPLLWPLAIALIALWAVFSEDLYPNETKAIWGIAAGAYIFGHVVGRLELSSLSLRDVAIIGPIWPLLRARDQVDAALTERHVASRSQAVCPGENNPSNYAAKE